MTRREKLEAMLKESPDDSFLRYALAMEFRSAGDNEGALARFQELRELNPRHVASYFQSGQILAALTRTEEAKEMLRNGIRTAGEVGDHHAAGEMQALLADL